MTSVIRVLYALFHTCGNLFRETKTVIIAYLITWPDSDLHVINYLNPELGEFYVLSNKNTREMFEKKCCILLLDTKGNTQRKAWNLRKTTSLEAVTFKISTLSSKIHI